MFRYANYIVVELLYIFVTKLLFRTTLNYQNVVKLILPFARQKLAKHQQQLIIELSTCDKHLRFRLDFRCQSQLRGRTLSLHSHTGR